MDLLAGNFPKQVQAQLADVAEGQPIVMLNLLRYRDAAAYPAGSTAKPCSGREAYQRYGHEAIRFVTAVGGEVIWQGSGKGVLLGPANEHWHTVLLVRYPSKRAFLEMIQNPEYQAITMHRAAALQDSRLIATTPE
jgi:uncharacterized protein (DUF1330 family)